MDKKLGILKQRFMEAKTTALNVTNKDESKSPKDVLFMFNFAMEYKEIAKELFAILGETEMEEGED